MLFLDVAKQCELEAYKLGLNPDEFWSMIPSEFFKYHKSQIEVLKRDIRCRQELAGLICTTIANFAPYKKRKKYKIEDFIGREKRKRKQTENEMFAEVKRLNALFGGEMKTNGNS